MTDQRSTASEDYLKQIYELALDESPVKTSRLAEALAVSAAAVTEMLKRLGERDLVTYTPYRGVELTAHGRRRALGIVRRHRLWEVFLHRTLGLPWAQVHDHACRLEHGTDDRLAEALDRFLGRPAVDPHGDPIPDAAGAVAEVARLRLDALEAGDEALVVQCTDEDPRLLDHLTGLGLVPGAHLRVRAVAPFDGPLTLDVDGVERAIGRTVARTLLVRRPPRPAPAPSA
jgi:DtxR family Mn-dependent transcriptional regulator